MIHKAFIRTQQVDISVSANQLLSEFLTLHFPNIVDTLKSYISLMSLYNYSS